MAFQQNNDEDVLDDQADMEDDELVDPAAPTTRGFYHRGECGKVRYRSQSEAKRSLRNLQNAGRGGADRGRLHVYFHRECRGWHVGHTDERMWK